MRVIVRGESSPCRNKKTGIEGARAVPRGEFGARLVWVIATVAITTSQSTPFHEASTTPHAILCLSLSYGYGGHGLSGKTLLHSLICSQHSLSGAADGYFANKLHQHNLFLQMATGQPPVVLGSLDVFQEQLKAGTKQPRFKSQQ